MDRREKERGYRKVAIDALDYIELCSSKGIVPLRHDLNLLRSRFTYYDKARVMR